MNRFDFGVLDDAGLHFLRNERWLRVPTRGATHAGEAPALALEHELARIWLAPGSTLSASLMADEEQAGKFVEAGRAAGWDIWATRDYNFMSGRLRDTPEVQPGIPARSTRWTALQECSDATILYAAITYLQGTLNTPIEWSPGHVGLNLIKQVNETPRRSSYIRRSERGLEFFVRQARENHHTDLLWSCPLADAERDSTWLHRYDKNNAYVAAASGVNLGAGEYILQDHPTFDAKMPGLWHIILEGESAFKTGARIPIPFTGSG